ncbi:MAG: hypothetical protein R3D02_08030 [Hyphomicrobiales bacterium]
MPYRALRFAFVSSGPAEPSGKEECPPGQIRESLNKGRANPASESKIIESSGIFRAALQKLKDPAHLIAQKMTDKSVIA